MDLKIWLLVGLLGIDVTSCILHNTPTPLARFSMTNIVSFLLEEHEPDEAFMKKIEMSVLLAHREVEPEQDESTAILQNLLNRKSENKPIIPGESYLGREVRKYIHKNRKKLNACNGDDYSYYPLGSYAQIIYRIADNKYILEAICNIGNAASSYDYYLYHVQPEGFKLTPLSFTTYSQISPESPIRKRVGHDLHIKLRSYDADQQIFSIYGSYMSVNFGCGYFGRYKWLDSQSRFKLIEYRLISVSECDRMLYANGVTPPPIEEFPLVYWDNP
ncbi:MAG: hypothetical protein AAGG51_28195 [Cyanobacteria bacterium P01_G01_bin.54]